MSGNQDVDIWGAKQEKLLKAWELLDFAYFAEKLRTDTPTDQLEDCPRRARIAETGTITLDHS